MAETFRVFVGGQEHEITVATGIYRDAAAAVPALLEIRPPVTVKIWCERHAPKYGPYYWRIEEDAFGGLLVRHLIPPFNETDR